MIEAQFVSHKVQQNLTSADQKIARENIGINADFLSQYGGNNNIGCHSAIPADMTVGTKIGLYAANDIIPSGTSYDDILFNMLAKDQTADGKCIMSSTGDTNTSETYQADDPNKNETLTATISTVSVTFTNPKDKYGQNVDFATYYYSTPASGTMGPFDYATTVTGNKFNFPLNANDKSFSTTNTFTKTFGFTATDANSKQYTQSTSISVSRTILYPYYYGSSLDMITSAEEVLAGTRNNGDVGSSYELTFSHGTTCKHFWFCSTETIKDIKCADFSIFADFTHTTLTMYEKTYHLYCYNLMPDGNTTVAITL